MFQYLVISLRIEETREDIGSLKNGHSKGKKKGWGKRGKKRRLGLTGNFGQPNFQFRLGQGWFCEIEKVVHLIGLFPRPGCYHCVYYL